MLIHWDLEPEVSNSVSVMQSFVYEELYYLRDILLSTAVPDGHIGLPHARHLVYGVSCHVKEFSGLTFVFKVCDPCKAFICGGLRY